MISGEASDQSSGEAEPEKDITENAPQAEDLNEGSTNKRKAEEESLEDSGSPKKKKKKKVLHRPLLR